MTVSYKCTFKLALGYYYFTLEETWRTHKNINLLNTFSLLAKKIRDEDVFLAKLILTSIWSFWKICWKGFQNMWTHTVPNGFVTVFYCTSQWMCSNVRKLLRLSSSLLISEGTPRVPRPGTELRTYRMAGRRANHWATPVPNFPNVNLILISIQGMQKTQTHILGKICRD